METPINFPVFDVAIIGAGAAGLYAAYCCGVSGLECCVIEALGCPGGQCAVFYPEKKVYGVPGLIDAKGKDFVALLTNQCLPYAKKVFLGKKAQSVVKSKSGAFNVKISDNSCEGGGGDSPALPPGEPKGLAERLLGKSRSVAAPAEEILAKYIIIASGIGDMKPNIPAIKGVEDSKSDFIQSYCMRIDLYKGKRVVVAGGGDSAADLVVNIAPIASKVTLIYRREKLNCENQKMLELKKFTDSGKLDILLETQILEIREDNSKRVVITNKEALEVDYIAFCYGFTPSCSLISELKELGLKENNNSIETDISSMETSIEGCYAIGDVATYFNKKKNLVSCFFEADRSVRSIKNKNSQEVGKCRNI